MLLYNIATVNDKQNNLYAAGCEHTGLIDNVNAFMQGVYIWEADCMSGQIVQTDIATNVAKRISFADFESHLQKRDRAKFLELFKFMPGQKRRHIDTKFRLLEGGGYKLFILKGMAYSHGEETFAAGLFYDSEAVYRLASRLDYLEKHDVLTGLVNSQTLDRLFEDISAYGLYPQTMVVADIEHFKDINDTLGYHAGNTLIRNVADVLKECFADAEFIARIGGGQYCAMFAGQSQLEIDNKIKEARMQLHGMYLNLIKAEVSFAHASADQNSDFCALYVEAMQKTRQARNASKVLSSSSVVDDINRIIETKIGWGKRQVRLQSLATQIAAKLGCGEECIQTTKILAKIADIGLIGISDELLNKRMALSEEEQAKYDSFVETGRSLISSIEEVSEYESLYLDIFKHYEQWQDSIALPSRIIAGIIGFDDIVYADTSVRFIDIKQKLLIKRGRQYCPKVVDAILSVAIKHYA